MAGILVVMFKTHIKDRDYRGKAVIYCIRLIGTNRVYVGQTTSLRTRLYSHANCFSDVDRRALRNNKPKSGFYWRYADSESQLSTVLGGEPLCAVHSSGAGIPSSYHTRKTP